jgi:hypothetical protein
MHVVKSLLPGDRCERRRAFSFPGGGRQCCGLFGAYGGEKSREFAVEDSDAARPKLIGSQPAVRDETPNLTL